ncbi:AmmeMemoRadiSam system radical SAM enzyme [Prevotella sp. oral taxon 376]|uniref:AmmeMemoRadiSam system radical SAM enzyme n=1 Tax=Prevotella sp. oral taxon 376 TaxID=712466 RepID=UPI000D1D86D0|nr:AmmeMemoRadiSam system radical SAM enzyme [Prevotella sp. oral taxon 376]PTL33762.1 AmmeMemoRadiSam system radical SAM enzyme [Prevotella sp. oral taxon 376]
MKECLYYHKYGDGRLRCTLCPHGCLLAEGERGRCGSRRNLEGTLVSEVYAHPCAVAVDPVEKKPLAEFHPGTKCLSLACTGCNLQCLNCQNHDISQAHPGKTDCYELTPEQAVDLALKHHTPGIAYTYTEPLTWYEYTYDTATLAHEKGLWNILVSAGFINPDPLDKLIPYIDAANIDLKAFSDDIYRKVCGARLQPVLDTLLSLHGAGVHLEITNLLIPGVNDDMELVRGMCRWLVENKLGDCPLHFSRFFPQYKMRNTLPTPGKTLFDARDIARGESIRKVYLGNL